MSASIKKAVSLLLCLLLFVAITTACNNNSNSSSSDSSSTSSVDSAASEKESSSEESAAEQETTPVIINHLTVRNTGCVQAVQALADEYAEDHPGFEYKQEVITDRPAAMQKVKTLVASNSLPEWFELDPTAYCQELVKANMLVDQGEVLDRLGIREYFWDMGLNYHEMEGIGLYTLPLDLNLEFYFYNKKMYEENDLTVPTTWDEFFSNCQVLQDAGNTPIAIGGVDGWPILRYFAMMPYRMTGNDWAKKIIAGEASIGDEYGTAAMEFIQTAGTYFQEGWSTMDYNTTLNLFLGGKVAMHHTGTWDLSAMQDDQLSDEMKGNIDFFLLPTIEGSPTTQNQYFGHGGVGVAFSSAGWNEGQEDFLKYMVENFSEKALEVGGFIPMTKAELPAGTSDLTTRAWDELGNFETNILTWDVILDESSVVYFSENLTALAMNLMTPEDFAKGADQSILDNLS